jgi:hypothetical protein
MFRISLPALLLFFYIPAAAQTPRPGASPRHGRAVVTNKDLEHSRLRREAQEEEYERTRRARGLPSKEELRRQAEEHDRRLFEWARQAEAARREAELAALWSELMTARQLQELNPPSSLTPEVYEITYASPGFYPYIFAPPVRFSPHVRRGHFGHRNFRLPPHVRGWPHGPRERHLFRPSTHGPRPNAWAVPRVQPPATLPQRRPR